MARGYEISNIIFNLILIFVSLINNFVKACTLLYNDDTWAHIKDKVGNLPIHLAVKLGSPNEYDSLTYTSEYLPIQM